MDQATGAASEKAAQGADPPAGADPLGGGRVVIERALAAAPSAAGVLAKPWRIEGLLDPALAAAGHRSAAAR